MPIVCVINDDLRHFRKQLRPMCTVYRSDRQCRPIASAFGELVHFSRNRRVCSAEPRRVAADLEWQVHRCGRSLRRYGRAERQSAAIRAALREWSGQGKGASVAGHPSEEIASHPSTPAEPAAASGNARNAQRSPPRATGAGDGSPQAGTGSGSAPRGAPVRAATTTPKNSIRGPRETVEMDEKGAAWTDT
jgi:hypothetical protein